MNYKKLIGAALSVVMLVSLALPATVSAAGTANILDYSTESVIVPTALKVALNPNGYTITTGYKKTADTAVDSTKSYYTESSGTYTKVASAVDANIGTYYEALTSTDQVVSLNYGIANKSTDAKIVKVSFAVTYTADETKTAIEFVDEAAKAEAYDASTNEDGAKSGELKMFLEVVSSDAAPTANTYAKATTYADGTDYYTESTGTYTKAATQPTNQAELDAGTFFVATTTIGPLITAQQLADVTMTKATAGKQAMVKGTTNKAEATVSYKLPAATFAVKSDATLDFTTTQTGLESNLEMTAIGGVAGFTITGKMNADADWTKADAAAITITPTYDYTAVVTGSETPITGAHNQIETAVGPSILTTSYATSGTVDLVIPVALGTGNLAATGVSGAALGSEDFLGQYIHWDATENTLTIDAGAVNYALVNSVNLIVTFDDSAATVVTVTLSRE